MTKDTDTPTDEPSDDKIEALEARVAELEAMTEIDSEDGGGVSLPDLLDFGLTRRQALMAIALVGAGYSLGPAITKSISEPAAASHGGATLGTQDNPLEAIYVHDLYNTTDSIAADSITTDELNAKTSAATYHVYTDGTDIFAVPQSNPTGPALSRVTGTDIGTVLNELIVNQLPPQGDSGEAAGKIKLKRAEYPGTVSNLPLATSLVIEGELTNHIDDDATTSFQPETIPGTKLNSDGIAFQNPDTDGDDATFARLRHLHLSGPGSGTSGSAGVDGSVGANALDWAVIEDCVIQDFDVGVRDSSIEFLLIRNSHIIDCNRGAALRRIRSRMINCGLSIPSNEAVTLVGGKAIGCWINCDPAAGEMGVILQGPGAYIGGQTYISHMSNTTDGDAINVSGGSPQFMSVDDVYIRNGFNRGVAVTTGGGNVRVNGVMADDAVANDVVVDGQFGASDIWVDNVVPVNGGVQSVNSPTRLVVEGWGVNAGDPSAGGQWNGNGVEGLNVLDTSNSVKYVYRNGGWV